MSRMRRRPVWLAVLAALAGAAPAQRTVCASTAVQPARGAIVAPGSVSVIVAPLTLAVSRFASPGAAA